LVPLGPRTVGAGDAPGAGDSPPLLLALETATRTASVALLRGEELIAEETGRPDRTAAESLLPAVDAVLREGGAEVSWLDALAVSIGPGSFTGLRVGLATAKGLAFGSARPVVPVPTLAALAYTAPRRDLPVVPLLDARRGEVYAGAFDLTGGLPRPTMAEGVYTPAELIARLPARCVLVGEGVALCGAEICAGLGAGVLAVASDPAARHVGRLGARMLARGESVAPAAAVPRYVRRAEAEVKRTGQQFESAPKRG
jgi:tRNA threonylcarbamoyladenosine biosynthesis protein TsaB